jgi:hypothetical protein
MHELMTLHANGLFLRREALDFGYRDEDLVAARKGGDIHRVRHGAYAPAAVWDAADEVARHRLRGQAVCLTHGGKVALSHTSGAAEHGLSLWRPDLSLVHVTRLDGGKGRRQAGVCYHEDAWDPDDLHTVDEHLVLGPETCAVGAASLTRVANGLVILDSALHLKKASPESLWSTYERRAQWPFMNKLQITIRLTRPGAQSVGETLMRHLLWVLHLPEPQLQFEVYDEDGVLVGITDFAWPERRLLGEFDGKIKYGRLLKEGETASDVIVREKAREDKLREVTGWSMIRYVWDDQFHRERTAARTRRQMGLSSAT